jgi:hypothetical protein
MVNQTPREMAMPIESHKDWDWSRTDKSAGGRREDGNKKKKMMAGMRKGKRREKPNPGTP